MNYYFLNPQDYNHKLAQTRAGRSSKSKLTIAKFSQATASEGWELREGFYFTDDVAGKYDGGMDAQFEVGEDGNAVFTGTSEGSSSVSLVPSNLKNNDQCEVGRSIIL